MRGVTSAKVDEIASRIFQLTRLMRGVTSVTQVLADFILFQLTRLMRGVTRKRIGSKGVFYDFNSHASCEA